MKNKLKILLVILLGISILTNFIQFKDSQKYKDATNYSIVYLLQDVFGNAKLLNMEITEIEKSKQINIVILYKIQNLYSQLDRSLFRLRDIPTREQDRKRSFKANFTEYIQLESEISNFMFRFNEMNEKKQQLIFKNIDNIGYISRLKQLTLDMDEIYKKHIDADENGMLNFKLYELEEILKELGQINI